jgi:branched-chain amino acid transport system substrate-binding protein
MDRLRRKLVRSARGSTGGLVASACLGAVLIAGCGSGSTASNGSSRSSVASPARVATKTPLCGKTAGKAATGTPIPVGGMTTASGGADTAEGVKTAEAFFACLNASGGINGRPVKYYSADDGLNPAQAAQAAKALVDDDHVVAIVGGSSYLECPVAGPIYAAAGVSEIESVGGSAQCFTQKNITSVTQGASLAMSGVIDDLVNQGAKKLAILVPDIPGLGDAQISAAQRVAPFLGASIVKVVMYKPGVQDATSLVLDAASGNPTGIGLAGVKVDLLTILRAARQQDMKSRFKFSAVYPMYSPEIPSALGSYWLDGSLHVPHQFAPSDATTPDNMLWREVMAKYAPGVIGDEISQGAFIAAKIFTDTLENLHGPINRATVSKALQQIHDYRTDMMCVPWSWGSGRMRVENYAGRVAATSQHGWKSIAGCEPLKDPILQAIEAAK